MTERETSRSIDAAAAAWVAREDRAPLSSADAQTLREWLEGDPRRAGALLRARAVALRSESAIALGPGYDPAAFGALRQAAPSRRRVLAWGSGVAASLAVATVAGVSLRAPRAHATERGEIRLVPLTDGSTVMLNTQTLVTVKYDDTQRYVRLVDGEADFTVLADRDRPFVVEAGRRRFLTSEGAFRVRMLKDAPVDVLVHQGRVEVVPEEGRSGGAALGPNTRVIIAGSANDGERPLAPRIVTPDLVTRELAWREGKIAFEGETLAEAAAAFARYSDTRIVIDDPVLAREPITGLFAASDPAGFGHAVADMFGAAVTERNGTITLARPSSGQ
jgi:transmembrane sensor